MASSNFERFLGLAKDKIGLGRNPRLARVENSPDNNVGVFQRLFQNRFARYLGYGAGGAAAWFATEVIAHNQVLADAEILTIMNPTNNNFHKIGRIKITENGLQYTNQDDITLPNSTLGTGDIQCESNTAYTANVQTNNVSKVNLDTETRQDFSTGANSAPIESVLFGDEIWVVNVGNDTVSVLNKNNGQSIATIALSNTSNPNRIFKWENKVYVVDRGTIIELDPVNKSETRRLTPPNPIGAARVTLDGNNLFIPNGSSTGKVAKFDLRGFRYVEEFSTESYPVDAYVQGSILMVLNEDGEGNTYAGSIQYLNKETGTPVYSSCKDFCNFPQAFGVDDGKLYVACTSATWSPEGDPQWTAVGAVVEIAGWETGNCSVASSVLTGRPNVDMVIRTYTPEQPDRDGDGLPDAQDPCPDDPLNDQDGDGQCGNVDPCPNDNPDDTDGDGQCNSQDPCPDDPQNNCNQPDRDGDGIPDNTDPCPDDPENDRDGDGLCENVDPCPNDAGNDQDGDGKCESLDPCPIDNPDDTDGDGQCNSQDPCPDDPENDQDNDGKCESEDPCPIDNPDDIDGDGQCNSQDPCPEDERNQCNEEDSDEDGIPDGQDPCPDDPENDQDGDELCETDDLCDQFPNTVQDNIDRNHNGIGDVCDPAWQGKSFGTTFACPAGVNPEDLVVQLDSFYIGANSTTLFEGDVTTCDIENFKGDTLRNGPNGSIAWHISQVGLVVDYVLGIKQLDSAQYVRQDSPNEGKLWVERIEDQAGRGIFMGVRGTNYAVDFPATGMILINMVNGEAWACGSCVDSSNPDYHELGVPFCDPQDPDEQVEELSAGEEAEIQPELQDDGQGEETDETSGDTGETSDETDQTTEESGGETEESPGDSGGETDETPATSEDDDDRPIKEAIKEKSGCAIMAASDLTKQEREMLEGLMAENPEISEDEALEALGLARESNSKTGIVMSLAVLATLIGARRKMRA